eukprot:COSAG02_NODE_7866_length_2812_cov_1.272392_1_plen_20_part_10
MGGGLLGEAVGRAGCAVEGW